MGFWEQPGDTTGFISIPIRYDKIRIYVPLAVTVRDGKTIQGEALMDLGSGGSVTLTSDVAKQYSLSELSPLLHYTSFNEGRGGESSSCDFRATNVTIGPFSLDSVTMDFRTTRGDHITAVNGRSVKDISFEERRTIFDGLTGVTLTIQRGDTTQEIRFEFDEPKI